EGTGKSFTKGAEGKFEGTDVDNALIEAKQNLSDKMRQIKSNLNNLIPRFDGSGGSCSLPVFSYGTIHGVVVERDLNDWCDQLSILSSAFIFLASVIAFRIVFGGNS
ncbi:MAG: hypothetical protein WCL34_15525, partial [Methylococcaceae bacterium]